MMASKSKRALMVAQDNLPKKLLYWSSAIFLIKFIIAINIQLPNKHKRLLFQG